MTPELETDLSDTRAVCLALTRRWTFKFQVHVQREWTATPQTVDAADAPNSAGGPPERLCTGWLPANDSDQSGRNLNRGRHPSPGRSAAVTQASPARESD
uniref:Uncharacterized protein n=1 Tax=Cryptomonas curvata TaxID=233186 RepID=A0A7S0ME35_9CRYP